MKRQITNKGAFELFKGSKIKVNSEESRLVQEHLFKAGFSWENEKCKVNVKDKYIYVQFSGILRSGNEPNIFIDCQYKNISPEEMINFEITEDENVEFKIGEKVLVKNELDTEWKLVEYSYTDELGQYHANDNTVWTCCISFKGNEILLNVLPF